MTPQCIVMASPGEDYSEETIRDYNAEDEEVRSKAPHNYPPPTSFEGTVLASLSELQRGMQSIQGRVTHLEEAEDRTQSVNTSAPRGQAAIVEHVTPRGTPSTDRGVGPGQSPSTDPLPRARLWADRPPEESVDYDMLEVSWDVDPEDDLSEGKGIKLFKVGEKTEKFLESNFSSTVPNQTRRQWRDKYGAPTPQLLPVQRWTRSLWAGCLQRQSRRTARWPSTSRWLWTQWGH